MPARRVRIVLALLVLAVSASCAARRADRSGPDPADCRARGGEVRRVCLTGYLACVTPFSDAGEPCTDSDECAGLCLVVGEKLPEPGTEISGACQADDNPCGCFVEVRDGKSRQGLCVD